MHPRIVAVSVLRPFLVHLRFADGSDGTVDLGPRIRGRGGVFTALQDPGYFAQVALDAEAGTITWPNGVDLDPDVLYEAAHTAPKAVGT